MGNGLYSITIRLPSGEEASFSDLRLTGIVAETIRTIRDMKRMERAISNVTPEVTHDELATMCREPMKMLLGLG
jgi:hypothetical protein